jgi:hypothetical protein
MYIFTGLKVTYFLACVNMPVTTYRYGALLAVFIAATTQDTILVSKIAFFSCINMSVATNWSWRRGALLAVLVA